jgi:Lrp/AsnC family leucine-responsive transcriptional regulator
LGKCESKLPVQLITSNNIAQRRKYCSNHASQAEYLEKPMGRVALDRTDRQILECLQADGRLTNAALAERVHLSPSACLRRVQALEAQGVIAGYRAMLDPQSLGRGTIVFVEIGLSSQREDALEAFERAVRDCPPIEECHLMSGGADYLLRIAVADLAAFEQVHRRELSRLPHVAQIRSSFSLRTVCQRPGPVGDPQG